ncbi:MAG: carboxypeptidase-like regulatory domain-containing protein, partial [Acidimicrobiia bacterium]|nr:carboxypeptidase-like regulatory domain-containing protein [Acidimicrobiia bacterium]
ALELGDIQLTKPATVVVKVTNGLKFSFRRLVNVSSMKRPYNRSTLVFQGLAPGRHLVRAFGQRQLVTVGAGRTATTVISKRQPAVTGKVVLNGRPVRNAPVTLSGANDTSPSGYVYVTRTGANGRYSFRGLSASTTPWRLRIGAEVSAKGTHALVPGTPHRLAKFRLSLGQTKTVDLVTRSARRGSIRMRFSDTGDDIISRRAAMFTTGGELVGVLPLRQGGSVVGGLAPGRYIVAMKWIRESGIQLTDWAYVRVRTQRTVRTALAPRYDRARVNVYAPPGSTVHLIALFPSGASASLRQYVAADSTQVAGASGITVFARVPLGMYRVYMSPSDDRPDETTLVHVRELRDEHTEVDLTTPSPEASIRGQLVNPATGQPWPWTRVVAQTLDCNGNYDSGTAYLTDGGPIVVGELHSGTYTCQLVGLRYDRGTPYEATTSLFHPAIGTYDVTSGQQLDQDFPVAFARRTG